MSSCDHGRSKPRRVAGVAVLFMAAASLALPACTVQPLYGSSASGGSVASKLAGIAIDPVGDRVGQQVRNKLLFGMTGGKAEGEQAYRMRLSTSVVQSPLGVTRIGTAQTYSLTVATTYEVVKVSTGDIVLRGTSRSTASYDRLNQVFANTRAKVDAENRAAAVVADDIRVRVAAAVATTL